MAIFSSDVVKSAISKSTSGYSPDPTAVDVFVYDTSKDSDGGDWRKRTQHTSWYNEALNSITRGSRKEFPAVAVIVATTASVFIYDGDDPDLPLWMRFNQSTNGLGAMVGYTSFTIGCVHMLNGILMVGLDATNQGNVAGLRLINFVSEGYHWKSADASRNSSQYWPIEDRNGGRALGYNDENYIVQESVNHVTAKVLPNTPIDDTTGLPVPTIAIATQGGVSVIRHDGTTVNKVLTDADTDIGQVEFTNDDGFLLVNRNDYHYFVITALEGAESQQHPSGFLNNINYFRSDGTNYPAPLSPDGVISGYGFSNLLQSTKGTDLATADTSGLYLFAVERHIPSNRNMVAYITKDYNSGYQHGDIKGAFLSDTDTTNSIEYVQNGYFNNDVSGWTIGSTGTTATLDANRLLLTAPSSGSSWGYVYQGITTEIGKTYKISLHYDRGTVDGRVNVRNDSTNTVSGSLFYADLGSGADGKTYYNTFTATATTTYILLYAKNTSGGTSAYDAVSVTLEKDRSVNNRGLNVFGTVTKSAVMPGAELVSYSGWQSGNYLQSGPNIFSWGTDAFSFMFWVYPDSAGAADDQLMGYGDQTANDGFNIYLNASGSYAHLDCGYLGVTDSFGASTGNGPLTGMRLISGNWNHCCIVQYDDTIYTYVNGEKYEETWTGSGINWDTKWNSPQFVIGNRAGFSSSDQPTNSGTKLALVRAGRGAPRPEQIKKIYEDEKHMFKDNAACTLYGTSDDVTALAYDEYTGTLHAGTSSGRSDFQGFCRINNTTTAVTTAISASDGYIAEQ